MLLTYLLVTLLFVIVALILEDQGPFA